MDVTHSHSWVDRLKTVAHRNRPSQKPQLWENLPLALRRRVAFELSRRLRAAWLDEPHVVNLSQVGFGDGQPPLRMEVVPREAMNKSLFLYGTVEISETRLFQALLRPGMCVIDVGANIGYHSLLAARIVGPSGVVHSFEPNAVVRSRLAANVELNGFNNVVVHEEAMTRKSGSVLFYPSTWSENSGISSIVPGVPGGGLSEIGEEVPCVSLDDFAATVAPRHIDFLKMDIEGAELDVIEGGRRFLGGADAPPLLFEAREIQPIADALRGLGYHVRRLDYALENGLQLRTPDEAMQSIFSAYEPPNYFAVRDPSQFDLTLGSAKASRPSAFRLLGRL